MANKVIIYSTPTCTYCKHVKAFFKEHNVAYEEFDVAADKDKRAEMVDKSGQLGVPVTDIDGQVVVGYDESTLKQLLNIA
ncbi:MAG: glutaredoxin domain-containing protein [Patescibacteria group bacterium]